MTIDTQLGGQSSRFPSTRWSAIVASNSDIPTERQHGLEVLVAAYWKPVYKYIRMKWHKSNEDAKDLTQAFFTKAIEKNFFKSYDPAKARFRTFLRTCLDGFVANEEKAAHRLKRGGDQPMLSLDFEDAERELRFSEIPDHANAIDYFDQEWVRGLFAATVKSLKNQLAADGKSVYFELFARYDLNETANDNLTYETIAAEFELPTTKVTNYLAYARREFRRLLLDKLRELTLTDEEFQSEARTLLGIDLK
jgi:RNA polymerase sigma factor (sigma-70 family)